MSIEFNLGRIKINGKDTFLYGGEFHYFRAPKHVWSDRLDQLIEAGCNLVSTYIPWLWHEQEEGQVDLTGKTRKECDLKGFLELVKEKGLYCIVRPGPYVMAETREQGIPEWLLQQHPEIIARGPKGENHPTNVVSYRHPLFLEKVKNWYEKVDRVIVPMQQTFGGPVIMYQLCNEVGMLHWVSNTSDFNETTLKEFQIYLEERHVDIEKFNKEFGINESSFFTFIDKFQKGLPDDYPSFHFVWRQFFQQHFKNYIGDLRQFAKEDGVNVPFIVNIHGFKDFSVYSRGVDYPIGVSQLQKTAEFEDVVLAGDFYPGHIGYDTFHDLVLASTFTRAVSNKDQPLFSAEFQSGRLADRPRLYPQDLDLNTRTCVAHGMNALNYYMFVGGENYEDIGIFGNRHEWQAPIASDGSLRPNFQSAKHLGHLFRTIGPKLSHAKKSVKTYVGFNPDDYLTDAVDLRDRAMIEEIAAKREHFAFDGVLRLLVAANIPFEAVNVMNPLSVGEVPSLWVFSSSYMDENLQQRLLDYVQDGGKLILYPQVPDRNLHNRPCRILADGIELGEWKIAPGNEIVDVLGIDSVFVGQRMVFPEYQGEVVASHTNGDKREVAAFKKTIGRGEVLILGAALNHNYGYQLDVIEKVAAEMGITREWTPDNPDLLLVERKNGDESYVFIHNYDEVERRGIVFHDKEPEFGGEAITLPPRSGSVFLKNYRLTEQVKIDYSTVELTEADITEEEIILKLTPVVKTGSIKLILTGDWSSNTEEQPDHGELYLRDIRRSITLSLQHSSERIVTKEPFVAFGDTRKDK